MSTKAVLKRSGFTLIELLVVIAIIGLLVSILVPSLSDAKWQAKIVKCQANLHTVGVSQQAYMTSFGLDSPWPYNNGTRDGINENSFNRRFDDNTLEGCTPGNPAEALMANLMAYDARPPTPENIAGWKKTPYFIDSAEALFCPADLQLNYMDHFDVWGDSKDSQNVWGTYPYVYPHTLAAKDPFDSGTINPHKVGRLAHQNNRDWIGRTSKNVIMYDEEVDYAHYNGLTLNGVVEIMGLSETEKDDYLFGVGETFYR